jgi:hypothetical protein
LKVLKKKQVKTYSIGEGDNNKYKNKKVDTKKKTKKNEKQNYVRGYTLKYQSQTKFISQKNGK